MTSKNGKVNLYFFYFAPLQQHTTQDMQRNGTLLWLVVSASVVALLLTIVEAGPGHDHDHGHHHHDHHGHHDQQKEGFKQHDRAVHAHKPQRFNPAFIPAQHPPRVKGTYDYPKLSRPAIFAELFQDSEEEIFSRWTRTSSTRYTGKEYFLSLLSHNIKHC